MAADLILMNLSGLKLPHGFASPELVAIQGNRILYSGSREALDTLTSHQTRTIDCQGGTVLPGFNDAHCHPVAFAVTQQYLDCSAQQIHCIDDIQAALRGKAVEVSNERWLRGANLDAALLAEQRLPNRWELDQAVSHVPVVLVERSGQHCVLNSKALERCGISDANPEADGGKILLDASSGLPNGIVSGNCERVARRIPPLADDEIEAGLRYASNEYLARGITSLQDASWSNTYRHWQTMQLFKQRELLLPRITMMAGVDAVEQFAAAELKTGSGNDQLRLGAAKIALDESSGSAHPEQADIQQAALRAHRAGFQLAFHVSDLDLLQKSLNALNHVNGVAPEKCRRPRFEHCPVCPPQLLPALAQSGAIVVSQPNLFCQSGPDYLRAFPEERQSWAFPYRSFKQHGICLALSSDSPLTSCDPLQGVRAAVTREVAGGSRLAAAERLDVAEAFASYSYAGAYASFDEHRKGTLAAGQLADLVVLKSKGNLTDMPDALFAAEVLLTVLNGKLVWHR